MTAAWTMTAAAADAAASRPDDTGAPTATAANPIRADPTNGDAKRNLELLLRRMKVVGEREGTGGSAGYYGHAFAGAGAGLPGSGY
jgi:hypothetical protein